MLCDHALDMVHIALRHHLVQAAAVCMPYLTADCTSNLQVSKDEFSKLVLDLFAMVSGKETAAAAPGAAAPAAPAAASGGFGGLGNMLGGAGGGAAPSGGGYPSLGGL